MFFNFVFLVGNDKIMYERTLSPLDLTSVKMDILLKTMECDPSAWSCDLLLFVFKKCQYFLVTVQMLTEYS